MAKKIIEHFTHPNHQLFEIKNDEGYICGGCKTPGIGTRFRCHGCDFDLHEHCGTCPMTLYSFMHSEHQLNLVLRQPQATRQNDRICDVCGERVEGLFYRCKLCDFDVHPVCTLFPQQLQHFRHPAHPLTLQPFSSSWCLVCKNECASWRYRCGICCVDIHLECLITPRESSTPRSVWQPIAPPAAPPRAYSAYAYQTPPPSGIPYAYGVQATPFVASNYPYGGVPPSGSNPFYMYHQHPQGNHQVGEGGRFRKKIYQILTSLSVGVLSSAVSAALFGD